MITEHTETTTTTPRERGPAAVSRRSITNTAPQTHQNTPLPKREDDPVVCGTRSKDARVHYTVLKQQPAHPTHWWAPPPTGEPRPPAGRREPRHNTPTPTDHPPKRTTGTRTGPVVSGPNSAPRTTPTHQDHRLPPPPPPTPKRAHGAAGTRTTPAGNPHPANQEKGSAATCSLIFHP